MTANNTIAADFLPKCTGFIRRPVFRGRPLLLNNCEDCLPSTTLTFALINRSSPHLSSDLKLSHSSPSHLDPARWHNTLEIVVQVVVAAEKIEDRPRELHCDSICSIGPTPTSDRLLFLSTRDWD